MIRYRLLEHLNEVQGWEQCGVAFEDGDECLLLRSGKKWARPIGVIGIASLREEHYPGGEGAFRWGSIYEWDDEDSFDPDMILQTSITEPVPEVQFHSLEELPFEYRELLQAMLADIDLLIRQQEAQLNWCKRNFVYLYENDLPVYPELAEVLWQLWTSVDRDRPPFPLEVHNIALLLYARAFGCAVEDQPAQVAYLARHRSLYAPLWPEPKAWGARASLSKDILVTLDSPVVHVWLLKSGDEPEQIIIAGKGLAAHRAKIFLDALVTAMRVQASAIDIFNHGLITIHRRANIEAYLDVNLPVLGSNAPLADADTAGAAMRELIRQLRRLEQDTGFVRIHEADVANADQTKSFFRRTSQQAIREGEAILWAPDADTIASESELVTVQPVYALYHRRGPPPRFELELSPELFRVESWKKLVTTYEEEVINRIALDARIRLDYYQRRAEGLADEKEQWDRADETQRQQRWGPTVTLNNRFDDAVGLSIWLRPPEIIPTKKYYEVNVPDLILSYEKWAKRMRDILEGVDTAARRPDSPFLRLIATRFFDAALRGCDLEENPRIQRLYREWADSTADLLRFLWRKKLGSVKAAPSDLFTPHTTFSLIHFTGDSRVLMRPYTLLDAKRSAVLLDPDCGLMIVRDASDYARQTSESRPTGDLGQALQQQYETHQDEKRLAEFLREQLTRDPRKVSREVIDLLGPQLDVQTLSEDSQQVRRFYQEGLANSFKFPRLIDRAETAMSNQALMTARESLERAQQVLPGLVARWHQMRETIPQNRRDRLPSIPENNELECRLNLLVTIAECLTTGYLVKDHLPAIYRSPRTEGRPEIAEALSAADSINSSYTYEWIEYLSQWELSAAYNKLIRDLPSEQDLTSAEQHSTMRAFDVIELMQIAADLSSAMATLSHIRETRSTALVKLGPALERALMSYTANVVYGDLVSLLEILTGRQTAFSRRETGHAS
jgi:hypothetical protein